MWEGTFERILPNPSLYRKMRPKLGYEFPKVTEQ